MDDQVDDELSDLLASTVAPLGLELVDLERRSTSVRVVVDRVGGVDLEAIAAATRAVSAVLDAHDPFPGQRYTLEVSSPGVERRLRTPQHFERAVGETVSVRTVAGGKGERRVTGRLTSADAHGFVLEGEDLPDGRASPLLRRDRAGADSVRMGIEVPRRARRSAGPPRSPFSTRRDEKADRKKKVATP